MNINTWTQLKAGEELTIFNKTGLEIIPGIWADGRTYWLIPEVESMIPEIGLSVLLQKVESPKKVQLYNVNITHFRERPLHVKLLIQYRHYLSKYTFNRYLDDHPHFSFVSPSEKVVFHIDQHQLHIANGCIQGRLSHMSSILSCKNVFMDHIWTCAKTGKLQYNPTGKGDAVSLFLYDCNFSGKQTLIGKSWVISGDNEEEILKLNTTLLKTY